VPREGKKREAIKEVSYTLRNEGETEGERKNTLFDLPCLEWSGLWGEVRAKKKKRGGCTHRGRRGKGIPRHVGNAGRIVS